MITALQGLTLSSPSLVFIDGERDSARGDFKIPTDIADLKTLQLNCSSSSPMQNANPLIALIAHGSAPISTLNNVDRDSTLKMSEWIFKTMNILLNRIEYLTPSVNRY